MEHMAWVKVVGQPLHPRPPDPRRTARSARRSPQGPRTSGHMTGLRDREGGRPDSRTGDTRQSRRRDWPSDGIPDCGLGWEEWGPASRLPGSPDPCTVVTAGREWGDGTAGPGPAPVHSGPHRAGLRHRCHRSPSGGRSSGRILGRRASASVPRVRPIRHAGPPRSDLSHGRGADPGHGSALRKPRSHGRCPRCLSDTDRIDPGGSGHPVPRSRRGRLLGSPSPSAQKSPLGAVEVDRDLPLTDADDDAGRGLRAGVALAVDDSLRDEGEVTRSELHPL
jgi:hypothetical protein